MAEKRTIAYISQSDPFTDRLAWSGTNFKLREGIESAGFRVKWIPFTINKYKLILLKVLIKVLFGKRALVDHNRFYFRMCAQSIDLKQLDSCDYLFFPNSGQIGAYLNTDKPIIYFSDATFSLMVDYYWKNQSKWVVKEGIDNDLKAIKRSIINIRSSKWAADSVVNDYGADPRRTCVIELGANIDDNDIKPSLPYRKGQTLNMLFSGVDWERKGGDIAVETVRLLNEYGINSKLIIAGIKQLQAKYENTPYIENLGFLNKNNIEQYKQYIRAMSNAHVFLLPTKAECAGIVYCEASAFGLPIFSYDTGGVRNYVRNGVNGYTLPISSGAKDFANAIINCVEHNRLNDLHYGGIDLYKTTLNWNSWGKRFRECIEIVENERTLY